MKIKLNQDPALTETQVQIDCPIIDEEVLQIVTGLRLYQQKLTGIRDGEVHIVDVRDILYIDSVDKKTFFYTETAVYESALRLYELADRLEKLDFFRASRSTIVNFAKICAMRPDLGGRLLLTVEGGEKLYVSRQYAGAFRQKLAALERGDR